MALSSADRTSSGNSPGSWWKFRPKCLPFAWYTLPRLYKALASPIWKGSIINSVILIHLQAIRQRLCFVQCGPVIILPWASVFHFWDIQQFWFLRRHSQLNGTALTWTLVFSLWKEFTPNWNQCISRIPLQSSQCLNFCLIFNCLLKNLFWVCLSSSYNVVFIIFG